MDPRVVGLQTQDGREVLCVMADPEAIQCVPVAEGRPADYLARGRHPLVA
jgi:hypothetical protein